MGKIQVLAQQTIDKIAAGEVVERPASVVKELVENSIDAGASRVTVEIRDGGVGFLRVTDNGSGIEREDIPLAFLHHSTSKIRNEKDLTSITSLGFRGEALSSICAVSMLEMITKTKDNTLGNRIYLEGGVQKELEEIGAPDGTTFIIRNLFYNTPARRKFLKANINEAAASHDIVSHLALSHPEISFTVVLDGQVKLKTPGNGKLKDVIYHVYGRDVAMNVIEVNRKEGPLQIVGYIGKPEISRGNRNFENYFINGRYIKSSLIAKGIEDGYKEYMMQHRYPFVCLSMDLDGRMLDINVHPSKMELRFSNQNLVYDLLEKTVKEALSQRELIPEVRFSDSNQAKSSAEPPVEPQKSFQEKEHKSNDTKENKEQILKTQNEEALIPEKQWKIPEHIKDSKDSQEKDQNYFMEEMRKRVEEQYKPQIKEEARPNLSSEQKKTWNPTFEKKEPEQQEHHQQPTTPFKQMELFDDKLLSKEAVKQHIILGQLFDTYWLVQYSDKLYIIDQHAAHEKVLYERMMKMFEMRKFQSQILSPPMIFNLSMQEQQLYLKYQKYFADMGFEIEEFGEQAYAVRAVPDNLPGIAKGNFLLEILDGLSEIGGNINADSVVSRIATMSCKAAVKGKQQMSVAEAKALIDELLTLENPYHCPHGRPTIISISRYELERKFKRTK